MQNEEIVMDAGELNVVATYRRTIHASLERIWENVLDWEHLPWLHRSAFAAAELMQQTPEMWQAWVTLTQREKERKVLIEVRTDRPNLRYWSRTIAGQRTGNEVLTSLSPVDQRATDIVVEFRAPLLPLNKAQALGDAYLRLYEQLWDEDERMMQRRQVLLDRGWKQRRLQHPAHE